MGLWDKQIIDQASDVPSIILFFQNFLQNSLQNPLKFFLIFLLLTKMKMKRVLSSVSL